MLPRCVIAVHTTRVLLLAHVGREGRMEHRGSTTSAASSDTNTPPAPTTHYFINNNNSLLAGTDAETERAWTGAREKLPYYSILRESRQSFPPAQHQLTSRLDVSIKDRRNRILSSGQHPLDYYIHT